MPTTRKAAAWALALLVSAPAAARPAAQGGTANPLEAVTALRCSFQVASHGVWTDGAPEAQVKSGANFMFDFIDIDTSDSTARAVGLSSTEDIVAQLRGWNLHFLDVRASGGLMVTTVFGQESTEGKLKAAYTRADYLPLEIPGFASSPEVSQHYGECEILD